MSLKWHRAVASVVTALAITTSMPRAATAESAADIESARAFFLEATRLGKAGRWREARDFYARSLALKPAPLTRYSLGVAQRETGRWTDALASFRAFVAEPSSPPSAMFEGPARTAIAELEARIGRVAIAIEPRTASHLTLTIDGEPVPPTLDSPREVDAGMHEIIARAPGYHDAIGHFSIGAGATVAVTLVLRPADARSYQAIADGLDALIAVPGPRAETPSPPPPVVSSRSPSPIPIILLASGGAVFFTGLTLGLVGVKNASDAPTQNGSDATSARTKAIAGDVLATTGAVTAGVGLVLLLTQRKWDTASVAVGRGGTPSWVIRF